MNTDEKGNLKLIVYSDADFASCKDTATSTEGSVIFMNGGAIYSKAKRIRVQTNMKPEKDRAERTRLIDPLISQRLEKECKIHLCLHVLPKIQFSMKQR